MVFFPGVVFFFFNTPAATETYTLSLHDALPIFTFHNLLNRPGVQRAFVTKPRIDEHQRALVDVDRKSTRLNSSHVKISYAVFCLKKKTRVRHDRYRGNDQG